MCDLEGLIGDLNRDLANTPSIVVRRRDLDHGLAIPLHEGDIDLLLNLFLVHHTSIIGEDFNCEILPCQRFEAVLGLKFD